MPLPRPKGTLRVISGVAVDKLEANLQMLQAASCIIRNILPITRTTPAEKKTDPATTETTITLVYWSTP